MKIFTKTVKVIGVTHEEASQLVALADKASRTGRAEMQVGPTTYLAVEIDDVAYGPVPKSTPGPSPKWVRE